MVNYMGQHHIHKYRFSVCGCVTRGVKLHLLTDINVCCFDIRIGAILCISIESSFNTSDIFHRKIIVRWAKRQIQLFAHYT